MATFRSALAVLAVACSRPASPPAPPATEIAPPPRSSTPPEPAEPPGGELGEIQAVGSGSGSLSTHQPSAPEAAERNRQRCRTGSLEACHAAALDAYYSPSTPETDRAAHDYFERACRGGYAPSCNGLGVLLLSGRGAPADPVEAARLFRHACDEGVSTGCVHLEELLRKSDPGAADRARKRTDCLRALAPDGSPASCPALAP